MSTLRHPLFNLLLGGFFGLAFGAAFASHAAASRIDAMTAQIDKERAETIQQAIELRGQLLKAQERSDNCAADVAIARETSERQQNAQQFRDSWYTLLYEPEQPSQPAGFNPLQLVDLVRPGLGTALTKLAPPPNTGQHLRVRWILNGYVNAVAAPPGTHVVYTRDADRLVSPPEVN